MRDDVTKQPSDEVVVGDQVGDWVGDQVGDLVGDLVALTESTAQVSRLAGAGLSGGWVVISPLKV